MHESYIESWEGMGSPSAIEILQIILGHGVLERRVQILLNFWNCLEVIRHMEALHI